MNRLSRFVACSVFVVLPAFALAQGNSGQMPRGGMMNQEQVQQMNENMARMQAMMQEMRNANSNAERQRLREQHMEYMQEHGTFADVPLAETLDDLEWRGAHRDAFSDWCERVASPALATAPQRWRDE